MQERDAIDTILGLVDAADAHVWITHHPRLPRAVRDFLEDETSEESSWLVMIGVGGVHAVGMGDTLQAASNDALEMMQAAEEES